MGDSADYQKLEEIKDDQVEQLDASSPHQQPMNQFNANTEVNVLDMEQIQQQILLL
jgi:hypothetical protein